MEQYAHEIKEHVRKLFKKWSIVGSILRGHKEFHDVDFLITADEAEKVADIPDSEVIFISEQRISIMYKDVMQVDFFVVPARSWELGMIAWGYGKANIHLRAKAKTKGCKLNQYELRCNGKRYYRIDDVEKILQVELPSYLKKELQDLEVEEGNNDVVDKIYEDVVKFGLEDELELAQDKGVIDELVSLVECFKSYVK